MPTDLGITCCSRSAMALHCHWPPVVYSQRHSKTQKYCVWCVMNWKGRCVFFTVIYSLNAPVTLDIFHVGVPAVQAPELKSCDCSKLLWSLLTSPEHNVKCIKAEMYLVTRQISDYRCIIGVVCLISFGNTISCLVIIFFYRVSQSDYSLWNFCFLFPFTAKT